MSECRSCVQRPVPFGSHCRLVDRRPQFHLNAANRKYTSKKLILKKKTIGKKKIKKIYTHPVSESFKYKIGINLEVNHQSPVRPTADHLQMSRQVEMVDRDLISANCIVLKLYFYRWLYTELEGRRDGGLKHLYCRFSRYRICVLTFSMMKNKQ